MGDRKAARRGRVEDHCCIDISALREKGQFERGASGVWSWSMGTRVVGAATVMAGTDFIKVRGFVASGSTVEPMQCVLQIARVPARFANRPCGRGRGAVSTFLLCPRCWSRRRKLYVVDGQCRRRACHRLGFAVETKSLANRTLQKAAKARRKLAATPGPACPVLQRSVPSIARRGGRGAGRRKYERLIREIADADRAALSCIMAAADRIA
jgi:hypothetical protein